MRGTFELAGEQAVDEVFGLILRRIDWMDEKGIRQWNVTGYAEAYPKTHYQEQARLGRLYGMARLRRGSMRPAAGCSAWRPAGIRASRWI